MCDGSPLECQSIIVGLNAATRLNKPFSSYWSDETGFLLAKFHEDYERPRRGNRPVIGSISREIQPCLETNLYAVPSRKARHLTKADREFSALESLFLSMRPRLVLVHGNEPVRFFETVRPTLYIGSRKGVASRALAGKAAVRGSGSQHTGARNRPSML